MIVDHNHRYICISVPKTGSISLQATLGYIHDVPEPDLYHQGIDDVLKNHPSCTNYFKFAMVRNPWDRLVSLYFDFTKKRIFQYSALVRHDTPLLSEFTDFEDLCLRLTESHWKDNIFFRSQTALLSIDGKLAMDFVGRFENLDADFSTVCEKIGIKKQPLEKWNAGVYEKTSYRKYYSDAARKAIATLYHDDVEGFGYEF